MTASNESESERTTIIDRTLQGQVRSPCGNICGMRRVCFKPGICSRKVALAMAGVFAVASAASAHTQFLVKYSVFCSDNEKLCIRGQVTYNDHRNSIRVEGRIPKTYQAGLASLRFRGTTPGGQTVHTALDFKVDGRYSELVNTVIIPAPPNQADWTMTAFYFTPD